MRNALLIAGAIILVVAMVFVFGEFQTPETVQGAAGTWSCKVFGNCESETPTPAPAAAAVGQTPTPAPIPDMTCRGVRYGSEAIGDIPPGESREATGVVVRCLSDGTLEVVPNDAPTATPVAPAVSTAPTSTSGGGIAAGAVSAAGVVTSTMATGGTELCPQVAWLWIDDPTDDAPGDCQQADPTVDLSTGNHFTRTWTIKAGKQVVLQGSRFFDHDDPSVIYIDAMVAYDLSNGKAKTFTIWNGRVIGVLDGNIGILNALGDAQGYGHVYQSATGVRGEDLLAQFHAGRGE